MSRIAVESISAPARNLVDLSGYTLASASLQIIDASSQTRIYRIQNLSTTSNLWINDTGGDASPYTPGSYLIAPGAYYEFQSQMAVSVYADSVIPFSAGRY